MTNETYETDVAQWYEPATVNATVVDLTPVHFGNEGNHGVEFRHSTLKKMKMKYLYTRFPGPICLPCNIRVKAWSKKIKNLI